MAAAITITPTVPQAGITVATIAGTGFTANTTYGLITKNPNYSSNWTTADGTNLTQSRRERFVTTDATGAFTVLYMFPDDIGTFTIETRLITEEFEVTSSIASATATPSQSVT
jgi:hypothetical protein